MNIVSMSIIGSALAMDAFGVSLGIGVNESVYRSKKMKYIISFGFFQFLLSFIGGIIGYYFKSYIIEIPSIISAIFIGIIGIIMLWDGRTGQDEQIIYKDSVIITLGISVSIDALIIGFSILSIFDSITVLFLESVVIGLITLLFCYCAFFISKVIRKISFIKKYSSYIGGITLIIFAIKMMIS